MSAIITDNFRRNSAKLFLSDIAGNVNNYYLGIGKSDKWPDAGLVTEDASGYNVAAPVGSFSDALEVLNNVATFSKLGASNTTLVIPNVPWASGKKYKAYNSYDSGCFYATGNLLPCYATTATGMYLCLANNSGGLTANSPSDTSTYVPAQGADNYVWILVQPVSQLGTAFITDQFIEVSQTPLTSTPLANSTAYGGLCSPVFHVVNGGSGYTGTAPVVTLRGSDAAGATTYTQTLTATVVGGVITGVIHSLTLANWPKGLQVASVEVTHATGTGAIVVPVIAPRLGYGHIPAAVMPSWYAGISVDLADTIGSDNFYTPYRQVSIVRNPNTTAANANALRSLTLSTGHGITSITGANALITDISGVPFAVADAIVGNTLYFHQNYTSGFKELANASTTFLLSTTGSNNYTYTAVNASECNEAVLANGSIAGGDGIYARIAGEVVFVENRTKITRSAGQTEKIKIIIQF
jgi:hypothetical protein